MEYSIISAEYLLVFFLTICIAIAAIFGPQSMERSMPDATADEKNRFHCRIFGWCILLGGLASLFGLLGWLATIGTITALEVVLFGILYFIGTIAHGMDMDAAFRRKQADRQRRHAAEFHACCTEVFERYLQHVHAYVSGSHIVSRDGFYPHGERHDEYFMQAVEFNNGKGLSFSDKKRFRFELMVLQHSRQSTEGPITYKSDPLLQEMVRYYVERRLAHGMPLCE